jgi:hypothetical protein
MSRRQCGVSVALLLAAMLCTPVVADPAAATRARLPDFSGDWVLVSATPVRPGYEQFWLGTGATIRQDAATLSIARANPDPARTAVFALNGDESQNKYVVNGSPIIRDSRATWNGESLLISTDTTTADGYRWLSNILRWSLESDGTLVVGDTEICGKGECPSVITTLRFKRKP